MEYFEASYTITKMMGKKDTNSLFNAVLSSQKGKMPDSTIKYCQMMIDEKIANTFAYQALFDAKIAKSDTVGALKSLAAGRAAFPNDLYLMNRETEFYLQQGKQEEALNNLNKAIEKEPTNSQLYLVRGNVFDNLANPKDAAGKDKPKPANYAELMGKAEVDYLKTKELNPKNFDVWYNLGALYNNWGGENQKQADETVKNITKQKEYQTKATELFGKATTTLEKALEIKPDDKGTMFALRKLYLLTNQPEKSKTMSDLLKK
jgi:tetratricopeptide (TPR) repeat protein